MLNNLGKMNRSHNVTLIKLHIGGIGLTEQYDKILEMA